MWKFIQNEENPNADDGSSDERTSCFQQKKYPIKQQSKRRKQVVFFVIGFVLTLIVLCLLYSKYHHYDIVPGWDRNTTRNISHYVQPNLNTTLLQPSKLCKGPEKNLLFIVICSSSNHFEIRQTIRETWGNSSGFNFKQFTVIHHSKHNEDYLNVNYSDWKTYAKNVNDVSSPYSFDFRVRTVFLVGQTTDNETQAQILEESHIHDDIIQESFLDTYNNLTVKTIMMLKWVNDNCADKVKYVMKSDDDTFINVPNLIQFLIGGSIPAYDASAKLIKSKPNFKCDSPSTNRLNKFDELLIGSRYCHANPISNRFSKWFMPHHMYDKKTYPNYLSGSGYLMSIDVAIKLYKVSMNIPLLYLEDVYLTGLCAESASIVPLNHDLFHYSSYDDICEFRGMITLHEIKTRSAMIKAYESLFDPKLTCASPNE